jgi:hypothetical protein
MMSEDHTMRRETSNCALNLQDSDDGCYVICGYQGYRHLLFSRSFIEDMALKYPISNELIHIHGVGEGKGNMVPNLSN